MTATTRWVRSLRAFSFPASLVPVAVAAATANTSGEVVAWWTLVPFALAALLFHAGTNVLNDYYDHVHGVDGEDDPDPTHAISRGIVSPRFMLISGRLHFLPGVALGGTIAVIRGPFFFLAGLAGASGAYFYTNARFSLKYRALGDVAVFLLMGPALVAMGDWALTGIVRPVAALHALPVGFVVTAILHGNNLRDISADARAGVDTLAGRIGFHRGKSVYALLLAAAYLSVVALVAAGVIPILSTLSLLTAIPATRLVRRVVAAPDGAHLIDLPVRTAKLHLLFGVLYCLTSAGLVL